MPIPVPGGRLLAATATSEIPLADDRKAAVAVVLAAGLISTPASTG